MADDLHQAIQAAATALHQSGIHQNVASCNCTLVAQTTVKAAAPVLLAVLEEVENERDHAQNVAQALRDQHAALQVYAADQEETLAKARLALIDLLNPSWSDDACRDCLRKEQEAEDAARRSVAAIEAVLAVDPPARGRTILDQVERLRKAIGWVLNAHVISCYFCDEGDAVVIVGTTDDDFQPACQPCADQLARNAALDLEAAPEEVDGG